MVVTRRLHQKEKEPFGSFFFLRQGVGADEEAHSIAKRGITACAARRWGSIPPPPPFNRASCTKLQKEPYEQVLLAIRLFALL